MEIAENCPNYDEDILIMQKDRANSRLEANIMSIFREIDTSGDGVLGPAEFQEIIHDSRVSWILDYGDLIWVKLLLNLIYHFYISWENAFPEQ